VPHAVLPVDLRSVAVARRLLRDTLHGRRSEARDDAILMISELVTNAVRHTDELLSVHIAMYGDTLRVDVTDDCPDLPFPPDPEHHATGGRGLRIVDDLADRWGITRIPADGKTVWFEIRLARPAVVAH